MKMALHLSTFQWKISSPESVQAMLSIPFFQDSFRGRGLGDLEPTLPLPLPTNQIFIYFILFIYLLVGFGRAGAPVFLCYSYAKQGAAHLPLPIAASLLLPARFMISRENHPFCEKSSTMLPLLLESYVQNATAGGTVTLMGSQVKCCGSGYESRSGSTGSTCFGPPGTGSGSISQRYGSGSGSCSGSGSFYHQANIVRKTLISTYCFVTSFLSLKNDVKVPSKSNMQENLFF